ncbi:L,D-transpeptidase [Pseudonocardia sp. GCM10023141]|uniref:L,D-transpeptidase n=1 Tax=Pseudonocardia sp. GCM10023141 TaxID=3252653 RepID=UPI0036234482
MPAVSASARPVRAEGQWMGKQSRTAGRRVRVAVAMGIATGVVALGALAGTTVAQAAADPTVEGTPCTPTTRACVDLDSHTAWLFDKGAIVRGPLQISSGGPGMATPRGNFQVEWKDKDHHTSEFNNAPMPFSVFFAPGGIAFHEGSVETTSAGCVHLTLEDASAFYDFLSVGDVVEVH